MRLWPGDRDCFDVLGIGQTNDEHDIKRAYAARLRAIGGAEGDAAAFAELREAYEEARTYLPLTLADIQRTVDVMKRRNRRLTFDDFVKDSLNLTLGSCPGCGRASASDEPCAECLNDPSFQRTFKHPR